MTGSSGRRIALGVGANVIDRITMVLIQLLLIPVLATNWGLERFGGWAMLITVPALLALSDLGFSSAATARMTMEAARGEWSAARTTMRSATQVVVLACTIIITVVTLIILALPESILYKVHRTSNLETRWAITLLSFYACLVMISALFIGFLRSNQKFAFGAILSTVTSILENGFLVFVVVGGHGIGVGAGALVAGRCLGLLATFITANNLRTGMLPGLTGGSSKVRQELLGPSLAAMAIPVASALLLQGTVVALGLTAGAALVPAFVAARTLSRFSLQGAQVFTTPLMPEFAAAEAHSDRRQVMRLVLLVFVSGTLIALPFAAVLALAGPWIIEIWSHQTIHASSSLMVIIAVSSMCGGIWNPLSNLIFAINRQSEFALAYAMLSAMAVGLTLALGARFGNMAAALALAFVDIAMLIVVARFAFKNWLEPGSAKLAWQDVRALIGRWVG